MPSALPTTAADPDIPPPMTEESNRDSTEEDEMIGRGPSHLEFAEIARAVDRMEPLSARDSQRLCTRAQAGDDDARRRLVEAHLHQVVAAVRRHDAVGADPMETFEAGSAGLAEAIATWRRSAGTFDFHADRAIERAVQPVLDAETRRVLRAVATELHGHEPIPRARSQAGRRA